VKSVEDLGLRKGSIRKSKLISCKLKNKNIRDLYRGINEFKNGNLPRINIEKNENVNLVGDPLNVLNMWKN
jgi:hypothetical protein